MDVEELATSSPKTVAERAFDLARLRLSDVSETFAGQKIGQFVLQKTEDLIWAFEKSIEWSVPVDVKKSTKSTDKGAGLKEVNGSQPAGDTKRPLPWIFFIPVLFAWRGTRMVYETASSLIGKVPINPEETVSFLRNRRRSLRAVRIRGKRNLKTDVKAPSLDRGVAAVFSKIASFVLPRSATGASGDAAAKDTQKRENKKSLEVSNQSRLEDDEKETPYEKLNRLSKDEDTIDDDPDFDPNSSFTSSEGSNSSAAEVSDTEDLPPTRTDVQRASRTASFIAEDIIHEETEDSEDEDSSKYEEPDGCNKPAEDAVLKVNSGLKVNSADPNNADQDIPRDVQSGEDEQRSEKGFNSVSLSMSTVSSMSDLSHDSTMQMQKISGIFTKKRALSQSSM